jgi:hypothetical protein
MNPEKKHHQNENVFLKYIKIMKPIAPVMNLVTTYYGKIPMSVGTGGMVDIWISE